MTGIDSAYLDTIKRDLLARPRELDDFRMIIGLRKAYRRLFRPSEMANVADLFVEFCDEEAERAIREDTEEELHSLVYALRQYSEDLRVTSETRSDIDRIQDRAEELARKDDDEEPEPESDWEKENPKPQFDIDEMFEALRHEITVLNRRR